tara:strand:- start:94 stop:441 length:348 start_codon:yes stop_codon:yes gene_type:complete
MKAHTEKDLQDARRTKEKEYQYPANLNSDYYPKYSQELYYILEDFGLSDSPRLLVALEKYIRKYINKNDTIKINHLEQRVHRQVNDFENLQRDYYKLSKQNYELVQRFRLLMGEL